MRENERAAHELVRDLRVAGIDAVVSGAGVHWKVEVASVAERFLVVSCFSYERAFGRLVLGINPANGRSRLRGNVREPFEGPEYLVVLHDWRGRVAGGRSRIAIEVVRCARSWLVRGDLEQLVED